MSEDVEGVEVRFESRAPGAVLSPAEERRLARAAVAAALVAIRQLAASTDAEAPVTKAGGFADPRRQVRRPMPASWRRR